MWHFLFLNLSVYAAYCIQNSGSGVNKCVPFTKIDECSFTITVHPTNQFQQQVIDQRNKDLGIQVKIVLSSFIFAPFLCGN